MLKSTMTLDQLRTNYQQIGVPFKEDTLLMRALLYYDHVKNAHSFLTQHFSSHLPKQQFALDLTTSPLLTGLCDILDEYIVLILNDALKQSGQGYKAYFDSLLRSYPTSIDHAMDPYPNTSLALTKLTASFQNNIVTACQRVLQDWGMLEEVFVNKQYKLKQLQAIQSTGSDFHKGGQQVLILTFLTTSDTPLKIVYKPSDLEVDCLLIGDTQTVNAVRPGFQTASLMEILNSAMKDFHGEDAQPFPTYKILPINPGSTLQPTKQGQMPIRDSYGYLEFLEYEAITGPLQPRKDQVCTQFYTLLGQLTAVACAFSLSDLHIDNVLVHRYKPYLIDLENALTRPIQSVWETEMLGDAGAIEDSVQQVMIATAQETSKQLVLKEKFRPVKNRLWEAPTVLVSTVGYVKPMLTGFRMTLQCIGTAQKALRFEDWFSRLKKGCLVRIVPLSTAAFHSAITTACKSSTKQESITATVTRLMEQDVAKAYTLWENAPQTTPPRFLCLQPALVLPDLSNFDIPVFYHQLNTTEVMDSFGKQVTIPETISLGGISKPVKALLQGRQTFFPAPPLTYIQQVQLNGDTGNPSPAKALELVQELEKQISSGRDVERYKDLKGQLLSL